MKIKLLFVQLCFCIVVFAQNNYYPQKINASWCVVSKKNDAIIIQAIYDSIYELKMEYLPELSSGLFCCIKNNTSIVINSKSKTVITLDFIDTFMLKSIKDNYVLTNNAYSISAIIDKKTNIALKIDTSFYLRQDEYSGGAFVIKSNNKYGLLSGISYEYDKICLLPKYDSIIVTENQSFYFTLNNKYGLYSFAARGKPVELFRCMYDEIVLLTKFPDEPAPPPPPNIKKTKEILWEGRKNTSKKKVKDFNTYDFRTVIVRF